MKKFGFGLIEIMIAITVAAILAYFAYASYSSYQIRANKELANQTLVQNVAAMERYYLKNGSYLKPGDLWPGNEITSVVGSNGIAYSISYYPEDATSSNQQAYCLKALPVQTNTTDGEIIYADRYGLLSGNLPGNCSSITPAPVPTPTSSPSGICSGGSSYAPCSGNCDGGVWSACSGNCHNVTICAGGTGCSGNCASSVIYGGGCSGNCTNGSIVYGGCSGNCPNSTIYGTCSGHCANSTCCNADGSNCSKCK